MNNLYFRSFTFVVLALIGFACSSSSALPTSPSSANGSTALTAEQLAGTWRLQSIQGAGQAEQARPANAAYTVTFTSDRFSTRADCNLCSASFTVAGDALTIPDAIACTRAACPTMAYESQYEMLLAGRHTVTVDGAAMVWTSPRGTLRFTR